MGDYDTLAEYTFCAVRDFEVDWTNESSFEKYVTTKAELKGVNLRDGVMIPNHELALVKSFLVNFYAMLEDFINYCRFDIKNLFDKNFHLDNGGEFE